MRRLSAGARDPIMLLVAKGQNCIFGARLLATRYHLLGDAVAREKDVQIVSDNIRSREEQECS